MAEVIKRLAVGYNLLFSEWTDPRTRDWWLCARPHNGLLLLGVYLMFVFKWGPRWMKSRPPFDLYWVLIAYNAVQIVLCAKLFVQSLGLWGWGGSYKWICEPVDFSISEEALHVASLVHFYLVLKVVDLLDTVFFVLRKKFNQVTFLHVYHHAGMVMLIWAAATYFPGGHGTYIGVVNCLVHTVMYSYYLLTIVVPKVRNVIWIKKFVTQIQIVQFLLFVVHMSILAVKSDCQYPRWIAAVFLPQNLFMLILFIDFYIKTYIRKPTRQTGANSNNDNNDPDDTSNEKGTNHGTKNDVNSKKIEDFIRSHQDSSLTLRNVERT